MNSTQLIKSAKDTYKELKRKRYEWRSFYNGFLLGYVNKLKEPEGKETLIMESIEGIVKDYLKTDKDLHFKTRKSEIVYGRRLVYYFTRKYCYMGLAEMGLYYWQDHSTVLYAINQINDAIDMYLKGCNQYRSVVKDVEILDLIFSKI